MKKIVIISLFILSILLFFYLIYFNKDNTFKDVNNLNKGKIILANDLPKIFIIFCADDGCSFLI